MGVTGLSAAFGLWVSLRRLAVAAPAPTRARRRAALAALVAAPRPAHARRPAPPHLTPGKPARLSGLGGLGSPLRSAPPPGRLRPLRGPCGTWRQRASPT